MRLATGAAGLTAIIGAVKLWTLNTINDWASTSIVVSAGLGLIVVALVVVLWSHNRQRRRVTDMRDSALW